MKLLVFLFLCVGSIYGQVADNAPPCEEVTGILEKEQTDENGIAWKYTEDHSIVYYNGQPYTGVVKSCYENGKLYTKTNYKDGLKEGEMIAYWENGNLMGRQYFVAGKLNGKTSIYDEDGKLSMTGNYKNGLLDGKITTYDTRGSIERIDVYENGEWISCKGLC